MSKSGQRLDKKPVVICPDQSTVIETFDTTLYQRLEQDYGGFENHSLVSSHEFDLWNFVPSTVLSFQEAIGCCRSIAISAR